MNSTDSWPIVVVAAACVGLAGCSRPHAETQTAEDPPTVAVARVTRGDVAQTLTVTAEFLPFQEIDVHAKVAGYLRAIYVDVGDRVREGQLLAVLEIPELNDDLHQNEAAVRRSQEEINRANSEVGQAESAHDVAHLSATRLSAVIKARPNLVAQQDIDEATGKDRVSEAQIATATAALAAAKEQLESAQAAQNRTKTLLAYTQITAPFAGVITHRYADTGAMIQAGTSSQTQAMPIVRLSQNARLRLVIPAPESAVSRIHLKAPVNLTVEALHKTFTGTVARFSDRLNTDTRTMRVEVDVPNPTLELVPGMYADASIVLDEAKDALTVPIEAIDRTTASPRVMLVSAGHTIEQRSVALGLESGDRVQLLSGVAADDLVVVGNRSQLKVGARITPKLLTPPAGGSEGGH